MLLAAVVSMLLPGCSEPETAPQPEPSKLQGVVVILLDTVRADHLSGAGYARETTPNIDALAEQGVRFGNVVSNSPWTLPSAAGLVTGQYTQRLRSHRLSQSLIEEFQQADVTTAAFTEGGFVSRMYGFDRGFDHYEEEEGAIQLLQPGQPRNENPTGGIENTFARASQWLKEHKDERFLLFIHTYEPHTPYTDHTFTEGMDAGRVGDVLTVDFVWRIQQGEIELTDSELEYIKALYDGGIYKSDQHVGQLVSLLEELGLRDRTLVAVTSDHGEELADQYPAETGGHGHSLRDPLLLVPLVIHDPTREFAVRDVSAQVRLLDVIPTVAELFGVPRRRVTDGLSLVPLMDGESKEDRVALSGNTKRGPPRFSVRSMGFKYIFSNGLDGAEIPLLPKPAKHQLYDLTADPDEKHNLADTKPELLSTMQQLLDTRMSGLARGDVVDISDDADPAMLQRLRSLGYIE